MFTATEAVPVAKVVAGNKRYPGVVALDNVNFTLNKGEGAVRQKRRGQIDPHSNAYRQ